MNKQGVESIVLTLLLTLVFYSCTKSEYTKMLENEAKKDVNYDSIFLQFRFGDSRESFYGKGWEQNKLGLIKQGPGNQTVEYMMVPKDTTKSSIQMLFFPAFDDADNIMRMDVKFRYTAWAPWNQQYSADSLVSVVQDTLMQWYGGNKFVQVDFDGERNKMVWAKVDANRRITMAVLNEQEIKVVISDLNRKSEKPDSQ